MTKKTLLFAFMLLGSITMFAQTTITGTVKDVSTGELIPGANIKVSQKSIGTQTDFDGNFTLKVSDNPPFTIEISVIGFKTAKIEITENNQTIQVLLEENLTSLDEIVVSASRTPERIMESPVTIERLDTRAIKNTSSPSFYDGLENLKGVDINTSSLTFKSVNTRGFSTFANERFVQLVDGMDNASPALNFALGNLLGMSELDVKTVEILPGAASALYGANAFNGIMLMTSKSPFEDQGISYSIKTGQTSQQAAGNNEFYDTNIRMAHAFSEKFAAKATLSYIRGEEWHATDTRNTNGIGGGLIAGTRDSDINYDGVNVYGDEVTTNLKGVGEALESLGVLPNGAAALLPSVNVSRTGYQESDLMTYEAKSVKFGASLNYRPFGNDKLEIIWNSKYGRGNTIYQGQNRYNIANFFMQQHKLEFKGRNFFVRGYMTSEDAGDSYDTRFAAININRQWVQDSEGNVVSPKDADNTWYGKYAGAYFQGALGLLPGVDPSNVAGLHAVARGVADTGRFEPGTAEFQAAFNKVTTDGDLVTGSKFTDATKLYHVDTNYNFRDLTDWADIQVGTSYREFALNSFGTIFTDGDGPIKYSEMGFYGQLQKKLLEERLKVTASSRYDKAQNFDGGVSPRLSLSYAGGENKNHNFRASFQTGFRNPTTQDQYIGLNTGAGYIIGTAQDNLSRFTSTPDGISQSGINLLQLAPGATATFTGNDAINNSFSASSIANGTFQKSDFETVKPEKVVAYEIGYRSALNLTKTQRLVVDFSAYFNNYEDFIAVKNVVVPYYGEVGADGVQGQLALAALQNGDFSGASVRSNSKADVSSYGVGLGLNTKIFDGFDIGLNYTYAKLDFDQASDPDFETNFNTPEHKVKFQFGKTNLVKNFGFNINARWQTEYYWQSTFLEGNVDARTVVDAQINYTIPELKSTLKLGGANLGGQEYFSAPGVGAVGSQYFISWTINN